MAMSCCITCDSCLHSMKEAMKEEKKRAPGNEATVQTFHTPSHLVVDGVHYNHWEEAVLQRLVEQLELAGTVVGLHSFIILILLNLQNIVS